MRAERNAEYRRQIANLTREAMIKKAQAGHVTGGRVFGYDNVRVEGHVERRINEAEAAVVRQIFTLCASGVGYARIAKQLNAEGTRAPRPQQGRPAGWSQSSVYEVVRRPLYRGEIVWNKTRKRDAEGKTAIAARPETDWLRVDQPALRIVSEELWQAAHRRLDAARAQYDRVTHGARRPKRDRDSKYLLTSFGRCACCGGGFHVRTRSHGSRRAFFYACTSHYNKGPQACAHVDQWPMDEIDREVLGTMTEASDRIDRRIITEARQLYDANTVADRPDHLRHELDRVARERCTKRSPAGRAPFPRWSSACARPRRSGASSPSSSNRGGNRDRRGPGARSDDGYG